MTEAKPIPRVVPCPQCGKSSNYSQSNEFRPFCSERCKILDFGDWANESNRIAGEPSFENLEDDNNEY